MDKPVLFSIIVPTYNRAHLLSKTINSILSQTYTNFEIIIVDDGSTDNTEELVQSMLSDKISYYKKQNGERAAARNYGSLQAKGDYINWFDSDDLMLPNHLHESAELVRKLHQYESGKVIKVYNLPKDISGLLYKGNHIANSPVIVRKDIALANLFNEDRDLSGSEDYELWLRIGSKYKIYASDKITVAIIQHDQRSMTTMSDPTQLINRFTKFIDYSTADTGIQGLLGSHRDYFIMKNNLLLAVDLVNNNHIESAKKYLLIAIANHKGIIFERAFYAFIKHYLRHSLS
jgi:glycosyltransferase involved in cell wall biosynthesis